MDLLLDNFKYLTHSPKNVEQLKKLVLQLAVQGKLTVKWREENPDVESASVLLGKIRYEKEQLIKEGKFKREKPLPNISANERKIEINENWAWERLGNYTINRDGSRIPLSKSERETRKGEYDYYGASGVIDKINGFLYEGEFLLIGEDGANLVSRSTPVTFIANGKFWVNNHAHVLECFELTSIEYLAIFLNSIDLTPYITGGFQPKLSQGNLNQIPIYIPPYGEQLVIVSKVESLFAQIDQLHELASKKASITDNSAKSLFGKINTTNDKQDLQQTWQLLTNNFNTVTQSKEGVNQLRQTILQLAFQGKLTAKWRVENPDAFPASVILEEIKAEKQLLTKEGKLRKELHVHKIAQNEQPFEIPVSWEWDRMGAISQHNSGKTLDSGRNKGDLQKYITTSNLYWGYFKLDNVKSFLISDNELDRCSAIKGDLLICEGGEAGRTAVWEESYSICFQNHIHRVRLYGNINPYFIFRYFQKLNFSGEINEYRKGMGISNMSSGSLASIPVPIPPIAEQEIIVSNINHLMSLCDELEKKIEKRDSYQERIMQAVVKQAFVV